jgi:hypothetical protein
MASIQQIADAEANKRFAQNLLLDFRQMNLDSGINAAQALWLHHRAKAFDINVSGVPMQVDLLNMAMVGDVEAAYIALNYAVPDDMSQPHHWLSQERINFLKNAIAVYMGWA